jgi:type VI secretion system secreted protein Hcp
LVVAVGAAGGGAALAATSVPGSGGVINACYEAVDASGQPLAGANLHIINTSDGQTCSTVNDATTYVPLNWNQTGQTGETGNAGTPGTPGAAGKTVTIAGGGTLTLPNREVLTVGAPALAPPTPTNGHPIGSLTLQGLKQGPVGKSGKGNATIEILSFSLGTARSTGSNTGGGSGKRETSPITIVKDVDSASPLLLQAMVDNEVLKTVGLAFTRPSESGKETIYQRITLTNATISSVERYRPETGSGGRGGGASLESISFNFQKIEITDLKPK